MNACKTNHIIEYIKTQEEFPFDVLDLDEELDGILAYFGIHPELDDEERLEIRRDLFPLASGYEMAEVVRIMEEERGVGLLCIGQKIYAETFMKNRPKDVSCKEWLDKGWLKDHLFSFSGQG